MSCELKLPISAYGLYPVTTETGTMGVELSARVSTTNHKNPDAPCAIKSAISAHLKAKLAGVENLPNSFMMNTVCKRCGDEIVFIAEEII